MTRLARIVDIGLKAGVLVLLVLVVGIQLGIRHGRWLEAREFPKNAHTARQPRNGRQPSAARRRLRRGPLPGRWWMRRRAIQAAQQYLATAEHYQVPALKQAYAAQAEALLRLVAICWRPQ